MVTSTTNKKYLGQHRIMGQGDSASVLAQAKVWKMGEYFCISHFSYCTIGSKDPPKPALPIVRYCLRIEYVAIIENVSLHNGNYVLLRLTHSCSRGTAQCKKAYRCAIE